MYQVHQLARLLLHVNQKGLDFGAEMAVEDHRRNRNHQAQRRVIKRHRDAVSQHLRVGARGRLRAEDFDHAHHRAEQTHQRRDGGERTQGGKEALQFVRHGMPRLLDRLLHDIARTLVVSQSGSEHLSQRRIPGELLQHLRIHAVLPVRIDHLAEQIPRHDFFFAQHHQAFDD